MSSRKGDIDHTLNDEKWWSWVRVPARPKWWMKIFNDLMMFNNEKMFEDFGCSQSDARFGHQVSFHDESRLEGSRNWRLWEKLNSERRMQIAALWRELQMSTWKTMREMFPSDLREFNERDPDSEMSYVRTLVELNRDVCLSRWCLRAQGLIKRPIGVSCRLFTRELRSTYCQTYNYP